MSDKVYLVMVWVYVENEDEPHIEVTGVFTTEEKAIKECITELHFYGDFLLDKANHIPGELWPVENPYPIKKELCIESIQT